MKKYIKLWYRGWWVMLMMLCLNIVPMILAVPFARPLQSHVGWYWIICTFEFLLVGLPIYGWIFEIFAKKTPRIGM